jgi:membrane protein DedA with SNARE-associated domain
MVELLLRPDLVAALIFEGREFPLPEKAILLLYGFLISKMQCNRHWCCL